MPEGPAKHEVKLLLVDDDPRNLDALEAILQAPHLELVRALTADEALRELISGDFAALVLDIRMPGMSGIELASVVKQRKRTKDIPIIFLTAHHLDETEVLKGYGSGAVDYLTKPINPEILKSKIGVFVDLHQKTRALKAGNEALEKEVSRREEAEEALRRTNIELERRVDERTGELLRANEALAAAHDKAVAASRAKDEFIACLSHELRTPLNPVLLVASDAASNERLEPSVRADFKMIASNIQMEARLIDDLLDVSRITQGKFALERQAVAFASLVEEAAALIEAEIAEKALTLRLVLEPSMPRAMGDAVRIRQVMWNVIKNAAKFTPRKGAITVRASYVPHPPSFVFSCADTGIGMTAQEISRAFELFSQGDHSRTSGSHRFGGLGLGLAISRMVVQLHGGAIGASSEGAGRGSTITVSLPLPLVGPEDASGAGAQAAASRRPSQARRILLVEDHPTTRSSLAHLLEARSYSVRTAASVAEAREWLSKASFDVLISDVGLPDGSGYDLMRPWRGRSGMTGIALTGYGMEEDIARSREAGFSAHLTKPVSVESLERVLLAASPAGAV
ncbi:MAG TPA: response regulator [Opitutaceae bacterium]|nr:response regulator [Opitutaceae bacterium]